jgi:hypothetical protein
MNRPLWTRRHAATLLASVVVALTALNPVSAYETVLDPDLALVPPHSLVFVTVRVADLAGKLGVNAGKQPWAAGLEKQTGIPLHHVERCTFVATEDKGCFIIRTNAPYKRDAVLNACAPGAKQEKYHGKVCHISTSNGAAVHFASDRIVIVGYTDAVKQCLSAEGQRSPHLADVLSRTGKHDLVAWVAATLSVRTGLDDDAQDQPREEVPMRALGLSAIPPGVEAGTFIVDVGDKMNIEMRVDCDEEASARRGEKLLRIGVGMTHAFLLQVICGQDMVDLYPDPEAVKELPEGLNLFPSKLTRRAEKGLQDAKFRIDGKTAIATIALPIDARMLRAEMKEVKVSVNSLFSDVDLPVPFNNRDNPRYVAPPNAVPESESKQDRPPAAAQPVASIPYFGINSSSSSVASSSSSVASSPSYGAPSSSYGGGSYSYGAPSSTTPAISQVPIQPPEPPRPPSTVPPAVQPLQGGYVIAGVPYVVPLTVQPAQPIAPPVAQVKFTVANVRKETAVLFLLEDNGKMTFAGKVPAGEAVDLQTVSGQRVIAVFADNQAAESFVVKPGADSWLLRPPPGTVNPLPPPPSSMVPTAN